MASKPEAVLQSRSGFFPDGVTVNGEKWEGSFYILSKEAYEALLGL